MSEHELFFEAHIELSEDMKLSQLKSTQEKIETLLRNRFHINHTTLQFEYDPAHENNLISKNVIS
jgi:cobalt-zinc-cadmium efflux system protein